MRRPGARRSLSRGLGCAALAAGLLLQPVACLGEEEALEAAGEVETRSTAHRVLDSAFDVVFLRTSGLLGLAAGAGLFVPAAWLSALGGEETVSQARETFVDRAANYVFTRPLGEF